MDFEELKGIFPKANPAEAQVVPDTNSAHEVSWRRTSYTEHQSGLNVTLDKDDQYSYGPETMTVSGVGKCLHGRGCLLRFWIENWTPYVGPFGLQRRARRDLRRYVTATTS